MVQGESQSGVQEKCLHTAEVLQRMLDNDQSQKLR